VAIEHCEPKTPGDCTPLPDRTITAIQGGFGGGASDLVNDYRESLSGQNIRLTLTVTNDADYAADFDIRVTQGQECPSHLI
jgi:hypothetical protein